MTYPDDRVLVGVIKRKTDLMIAKNEHWYRIPKAQMPRGVDVEYIALLCEWLRVKGYWQWYSLLCQKNGLRTQISQRFIAQGSQA